MKLRKLLFKNSVSGFSQGIINILLVFSILPLIINILGAEEYGMFSLIIIIGNLNVFTNLGLTNALVKFLASQGKIIESNYDIIVTTIIIACILIPFTFGAIIFNKIILIDFLNIPFDSYKVVKLFFFYQLGANFFLILGQIPKAALDAEQKIVTTNILQIIYNFCYWGLIATVLLLGYRLEAVGLAVFFASLVWFLLINYNFFRYWGHLSFSGLKNNYKRIVRKQLSYSLKIYSSGVIGFFYEPFSKILIAHFIGVTEVGFFDIALRIKNQLFGVISKIFYPLYPLLSSLDDKNKIRLLVHDIEQKTFFIVIPMITIIIFTINPFVQLWIGHDVQIISISIMLILSSFMFGSITVYPNYLFLVAKGHAAKTIILQFINVIFNFVVFYLTLSWLGYYSAVVGNIVAILVSFLFSLLYQKKYLDSLIFDDWNQIGKIIFLAFINLVIGYLLSVNIIDPLTRLIIIPVILTINTLIIFYLLKFFTFDDFLRYFGKSVEGNKIIKSFIR
jgi:O-antigen/teichoic acid export membrane protein